MEWDQTVFKWQSDQNMTWTQMNLQMKCRTYVLSKTSIKTDGEGKHHIVWHFFNGIHSKANNQICLILIYKYLDSCMYSNKFSIIDISDENQVMYNYIYFRNTNLNHGLFFLKSVYFKDTNLNHGLFFLKSVY